MHKLRSSIIVYASAGVAAATSLHAQWHPLDNSHSIDDKVPAKLGREVADISRSMGISNPERISVCITEGLSSWSCGSTSLPNGALLGLSRFHTIDSLDAPALQSLRFNGQPVMETVTDLTARLDMLVPTPAQTAFVIAHEASHIKHNDALTASLTLPAYILLCFHSTTLASRLLSSRLGTALALAASIATCLCAEVMLMWYHELRADREAAESTQWRARGGLEYFTYRLQLQKHLRELSGLGDASGFDENGDANMLLARIMHPPLSLRLRRLQEHCDV